jgi:hypothetical protein
MVQNGKFAACAFAFERQLKSVDFPTLGKPTIPHFKDIVHLWFDFIACAQRLCYAPIAALYSSADNILNKFKV